MHACSRITSFVCWLLSLYINWEPPNTLTSCTWLRHSAHTPGVTPDRSNRRGWAPAGEPWSPFNHFLLHFLTSMVWKTRSVVCCLCLVLSLSAGFLPGKTEAATGAFVLCTEKGHSRHARLGFLAKVRFSQGISLH